MELEKCQTIPELHETLLDGFDKEPLKSYYLQALQRAYTLGMLKGAELMREAAAKHIQLGFCTTTEEAQDEAIAAILRALSPADVIKPQGKTDM